MGYLTGRGLDKDLAITNGWYVSYAAGDSRERIVMPATNTKGYVYWQARATDPSVEKRYRSPAYAVGDSVIVVWPDEYKGDVAIVEGPMDALAAAMHGYAGVAVMGKTPGQETVDHICKLFPSSSFTLIPDSDGYLSFGRLALALCARGKKNRTLVIWHKDLASMTSEDRNRLLWK